MMWLIYLYGLLGSLLGLYDLFLVILFFVAPIVLIVFIIWAHSSDTLERMGTVKKFLIAHYKKYIYFLVAVLVTGVLIPDQDNFAAMVLIPRIAQNKDVQQLPSDAAKLLNVGLQKWVKELEKDNSNANK